MTTTIVEAFLADNAFLDRSKIINEFLVEEDNLICSLSPKALSYFKMPRSFQDKRSPESRSVNWSAETVSSMVVDEDSYGLFVDTINSLSPSVMAGFFKIVDILAFSYNSGLTREQIEDNLTADSDIVALYEPNSFLNSASIFEGTVFRNSGLTDIVDVPTFIRFSITVPQGSDEATYVITLFTSVAAWLTGYDISTIVKIIPPLPYAQLYSSSITNSEANVFDTAASTAILSYNTTKDELGTVSVSGITEYMAVLTDSSDATVSVPFNILYKGRSPTLTEIRAAIRDALLGSGVGNEAGWEARIPGVFVAGRFYVVPLWDLSISKPDQVIYPSILDYNTVGEKTNLILDSIGFGDLREHTNVLPVYYDRMTLVAVPDLSGVVDIQQLIDIIPDYQNWSPSDENFAYMSDLSQRFSNYVNNSIALNVSGGTSDDIVILNENLLTFYSFVVDRYEICLITKECYTEILESTQ